MFDCRDTVTSVTKNGKAILGTALLKLFEEEEGGGKTGGLIFEKKKKKKFSAGGGGKTCST